MHFAVAIQQPGATGIRDTQTDTLGLCGGRQGGIGELYGLAGDRQEGCGRLSRRPRLLLEEPTHQVVLLLTATATAGQLQKPLGLHIA